MHKEKKLERVHFHGQAAQQRRPRANFYSGRRKELHRQQSYAVVCWDHSATSRRWFFSSPLVTQSRLALVWRCAHEVVLQFYLFCGPQCGDRPRAEVKNFNTSFPVLLEFYSHWFWWMLWKQRNMMMRLVLNREVFSAALRSKTPARMTCRALFDFCTSQLFLNKPNFASAKIWISHVWLHVFGDLVSFFGRMKKKHVMPCFTDFFRGGVSFRGNNEWVQLWWDQPNIWTSSMCQWFQWVPVFVCRMQRPKLTSTCAKARTRWVFSFFQFFTRSFTAIVQGFWPCPHVYFNLSMQFFQPKSLFLNPCTPDTWIYHEEIAGTLKFGHSDTHVFDVLWTIWQGLWRPTLESVPWHKLKHFFVQQVTGSLAWAFTSLGPLEKSFLVAWCSEFPFFCCRFQRACLIFMASSLSPSRF